MAPIAKIAPRRRGHTAIILLCMLALLGIAAAGYWYLVDVGPARPAARAEPPTVTTATAALRDVPVYLSGLGIVQASNTTAIHTQVDGKLQSVAFVEGQTVRKGDLLVQIDPRLYQAALDQAKAKKAQDEAQLVSATKDLERSQTLVRQATETQQNLDRQTATVAQLKAAIEADRAAIESAQTLLDYTAIRAPTDGRMGIRNIDPGNIVHANDTAAIATLTQTRPIAVIFTLPEKSLNDVRDAMTRGPVEVVAYDQDDARPLATGTLLLIDNQIDQSTGTIKLKALFPNEDERLWSGEFVHAHLLNDTRKNAVTVPAIAIQRGPQGLFVWQVRADGTAHAQPVETPVTHDDVAVVSQGLAAGDEVVVKGQYRLQNGARVQIRPSTAADGG